MIDVYIAGPSTMVYASYQNDRMSYYIDWETGASCTDDWEEETQDWVQAFCPVKEASGKGE